MEPVTRTLPEGLAREDIVRAARIIDDGAPHRFGISTRYDVLIGDRRYPPKAVVGIALEKAGLDVLDAGDFRGGQGSPCFRVLKSLGFAIVAKPAGAIDPSGSTSGKPAGLKRRTNTTPPDYRSIILHRDDGKAFDATLGSGTEGEAFGLIIESHGGGGRNDDYEAAVRHVFDQLRNWACLRVQVRLVSKPVLREISRSGQPLTFGTDDRTWLDLESQSSTVLQKTVGEAVRRIRTTDTAKGSGNSRKRILIDAGIDARSWREVLAPSSSPDDSESPGNHDGTAGSGREQTLASITVRRGQPAFRRALLRAYGGRCAVTGTALDAVLEAAHIRPYDGPATNRTSNGLLLRADIHTLFDLDLLRIDPDGRIALAGFIGDAVYRSLDGRTIRLPDDPADHPDRDALESRLQR